MPNDPHKPTAHNGVAVSVSKHAATHAKPSGAKRPVATRTVMLAACLLGLPVIAAFMVPKIYPKKAVEAVPTATVGLNSAGKWEVLRKKDPMSDASSATVVLSAEGASQYDSPIFGILCSSAGTAVVVNWRRYLGAKKLGDDFWKDVVVRIGDGAPMNEEWEVRADGTTAVRIDFGDEMDFNFVKAMRASEKLALRVEPYAENPYTVSFDIRGLTEALMQARPECDWHLKDVVLQEAHANGALGTQPPHTPNE